MSAWVGVATAAVLGGYALWSRRLASTPLTAPMVLVAFGVLIGPAGLGLIDLEHDAEPVRQLVEAALTLVLFTDAMTVRRRDLRSGGFLPLRLLAIGLPLTVGLGWLLAWPLLPGLSVWELALVGVILAPTDAALGKAAMTDRHVPALVRQGLNVESGLNDGMVLPFFVMFLAAVPGTDSSGQGVVEVFLRALVLSTVLGLVAGWFGGRLLCWSRDGGLATREWRQVFVLAVAAGSYGLALVVGGSGFIAAWVAGFAFGAALRAGAPAGAEGSATRGPAKGAADGTGDFAENLGGLLANLSCFVFGAVLLGPTLEHLEWRTVGYALLSLTVVRMFPVALSLLGSGLRPPTWAYIGWFGPRGLASIVFGLLVVEEYVPGVELLGRTVAVTVGLSVYLHGASAVTLANRYGRWHAEASAAAPGLREGAPASEDERRREA